MGPLTSHIDIIRYAGKLFEVAHWDMQNNATSGSQTWFFFSFGCLSAMHDLIMVEKSHNWDFLQE